MLPLHVFPLFRWHHIRLLVRRPNASIVCQILFPQPLTLGAHPSSRTQLLLDSVFSPAKVENVLSTLDFDSATEPDGIHSSVLKICSAGLAFPRSAFFTLPFVPGHLASAWKSANITASLHKKVKKPTPLTTDLSQFFHPLKSFLFFQWPHLRSSTRIQTWSLHLRQAATSLPTMDGGPQCET